MWSEIGRVVLDFVCLKYFLVVLKLLGRRYETLRERCSHTCKVP